MYNIDYVSGKGIPALLNKESNLKGLEIGTDLGETAEFILMELPNVELHAVDPYSDFIDWNGNVFGFRDQTYENVLARFAPYGERFVMHRNTSDNAVNDFAANEFDFIFVDGLHTYEQVLLDCQNYYSKLKDGGYFFGHDYYAIDGVRQAVDEFAATLGKEILFTDSDVWYWTK